MFVYEASASEQMNTANSGPGGFISRPSSAGTIFREQARRLTFYPVGPNTTDAATRNSRRKIGSEGWYVHYCYSPTIIR